MPGAGKPNGIWAHTTGGNNFVDMRENTFFNHANYTTHTKPPIPIPDGLNGESR